MSDWDKFIKAEERANVENRIYDIKDKIRKLEVELFEKQGELKELMEELHLLEEK